jgi:hypothetical protein
LPTCERAASKLPPRPPVAERAVSTGARR